MSPNEEKPLASDERDLGLDVPITRRDFLNSTLLASGAVLVTATPSSTNRGLRE